jgi:ABC-type multidrug transport system fused ATPase/permease subunit
MVKFDHRIGEDLDTKLADFGSQFSSRDQVMIEFARAILQKPDLVVISLHSMTAL